MLHIIVIYLDISSSAAKKYNVSLHSHWNLARSVSTVTDYWLDNSGSIPSSARLFSSAQHPYCLWGPPSPLSNVYWADFPQE